MAFHLEQFIAQSVTFRSESLFEADLKAHEQELRKEIRGRRVCVIGGAGSIGSAFVKEILVNHGKAIHIVLYAGFLKHLSFYGVLRRFPHMYGAADGIQVVLLFVSGKQNAAVLHNDCRRSVSEPPVFICKPTIVFHVSSPLVFRFDYPHFDPF